RRLLALGLGLTLAFVVLRSLNQYGDPQPWKPQEPAWRTALAFLACTKYPPSLLFLLMTLGPAITFLAVADRVPRALARPLVVFGRVPLFYYLMHFLLIYLITRALALATYGSAGWGVDAIDLSNSLPEKYGYSLPMLYLVWAGCVLALYPLCRWFAGLKRRHPGGLLSYL